MNISLKQARLMNEITQDAIAKKLEVSTDTYRKLERNPELVTVGQAKEISEILGVAYDKIFFSNSST